MLNQLRPPRSPPAALILSPRILLLNQRSSLRFPPAALLPPELRSAGKHSSPPRPLCTLLSLHYTVPVPEPLRAILAPLAGSHANFECSLTVGAQAGTKADHYVCQMLPIS